MDFQPFVQILLIMKEYHCFDIYSTTVNLISYGSIRFGVLEVLLLLQQSRPPTPFGISLKVGQRILE